jgi:carboxypeptidase T
MRSSSFMIVILSSWIGLQCLGADRYQTILSRMEALQAKYPDSAEMFSIGANDDGVEIKGIRISTTPKQMDPKKVAHVLVGTHHGNELGAAEFSMKFVEDLLNRYHSDELYKGKLNDLEWAIIPVLNISGYNAANRYEHGVDPNRDYPGPCVHVSGAKLKSIQNLINFIGQRTYVGSLTVHGYVGALTYPWGVSTSNTHTADHNTFAKITEKAAEHNGYQVGTSTDVVYPCDGSYEDYAYWKHGMWSLLLELKNGDVTDIQNTSLAIASYYDQLDSTPSTHHDLNGECGRSRKPDLHNE